MSSATTLTFLSLGNPTGLKFIVEHGGLRAIFDFGREHAPGRALFSLGLVPRPGRELADELAVGIAPKLSGVYDAWDGRTAVFLSHLHLDHSGLVHHLHPDVPLYYPAAMEPLRAAVEGSGYLPWRRPPGTQVADGATVGGGELSVQFLAVDHDLPGASGFLVRTPELALAFTGDHRWHGSHPELTAAFAQAARGADVLVQEGVTLGAPPPGATPLSEHQVWAGFERLLLERTSGLVIVNAYPMNRERVAAFAAACERHGRRFLMEAQAAQIAGYPGVLTDPGGVAADPAGHCLQLGFGGLPSLIDLQPPPGSVYVHSDGAPMGPFDPAWTVMEAWLARFGLEFVGLGSTGHSWPEDIVRMVQAVRPGLVVPVHSRSPEALEVPGVPRLLAEPQRPYAAAELKALARQLFARAAGPTPSAHGGDPAPSGRT